MIRVLFFAQLKEQLGCEQLDFPSAGIGNLADLKAALTAQGEQWQPLTQTNLMMAINQEMADLEDSVADRDEVAFFPPVTGG
ncbi:molybdopterin converting factor subunit 1 [Catenovulum sp. SM1970]|uniref:molybdopterin converting factor subunit 1 n=1 Tax=Marinifaba aquimaris TaxID=2741323 RepID=UPI001572A294|nr:molybdopterin converting factor subunit 1 [Marinifaba aquimaris]NTS76205.1 molybdopterin converting factor subunit 1 [Marinifaba aquimaris]